MDNNEIKQFITKIIREEFKVRNIEINKIVLFGSQSRGNGIYGSDWDFLISSGKELEFSEKVKLTTAIQRRIALEHVSADIIIKSQKKIEQEKNNVGVITYYALKDGVAV